MLGSGRRPYVVAGDDGLMIVCQEPSSLVRAGVNAAIFLISDRGYAIGQAFVNLEAFTDGESFAPFDVLLAWDYAALARALDAVEGVRGVPSPVEGVVPEKDSAPQFGRLVGEFWPDRKYARTLG